jgi:hypothetical protein
MVGTYALEVDSPTTDVMDAPAAPPCRPTLHAISDVASEPAPVLPGTDLRVRLESHPVPLRVAAGAHWATGIAIEAELPWLAIGTALDLELPDGGQRGGRIQSFEVDVTSTGSACLRIFADLSPHAVASTQPAAAAGDDEPEPSAAPVPRPWLRPLLFILGTSIGVHAGLHAPPLRSLVASAELLVRLAAGN